VHDDVGSKLSNGPDEARCCERRGELTEPDVEHEGSPFRERHPFDLGHPAVEGSVDFVVLGSCGRVREPGAPDIVRVRRRGCDDDVVPLRDESPGKRHDREEVPGVGMH
jgi:hypothetical protein